MTNEQREAFQIGINIMAQCTDDLSKMTHIEAVDWAFNIAVTGPEPKYAFAGALYEWARRNNRKDMMELTERLFFFKEELHGLTNTS